MKNFKIKISKDRRQRKRLMMNKKKRMVCFDLDMTLLDHSTWKIPESAMKAIEILRKDSVIVVASGRNMDHSMSVMYRDLINPDAIIHMNGTRVVAEGEVLYEHLMDKDRLKRLLTYAVDNDICIGLSVGDGDYFTVPEQVIQADQVRWGKSERNFKDAWELMEMPVRTLSYTGGPEGAKKMEEAFPEFKFPMFAGLMGADVVEQEASKANGLRRLCEYYGIDRADTVAFGDSMNDYEIVQEAGIGIAMGNAVERLKEAADYVTADIDQDGVWKACVHFGWVKETE